MPFKKFWRKEMRKAEIKRTTAETDIEVKLVLGGDGKYDIKSGSGFFDHMFCPWTRRSFCAPPI